MGKNLRASEGTVHQLQGNFPLIQEGRKQSEEDDRNRILAFGDNQPIVKESKTLWDIVIK